MVNDSITQRHVKELLKRYPDLEQASEKLIIAYSILKNCAEMVAAHPIPNISSGN